MAGTSRAQTLAAISRTCSDPRDTLSVSHILDDLRAHGTDLAEGTFGTHTNSQMSGDSPHHDGTTYDDLERVGRGVFRLRLGRKPHGG
jgi:hypothetical protein